LGLAIAGHLNWLKLPLYMACQFLGGYLGSLLAYGLYKDQFLYLHIGNPNASVPEWDSSNGGTIMSGFSPSGGGTFIGVGIATEVCLTAILLMGVMGAIDKGNMKIPSFMVPFLLCLTVAALAMTYGVVSGSVLNPARDLSPRLAAYTLGWKKDVVFQNQNFKKEVQEWWLVGIFGPLIGGVVGVLIYCFCVGAHLTNTKDEDDTTRQDNGKSNDWRTNTQFVPRAGQQQQPVPLPVVNHGPANAYNGPVNGGGGYNNGGYIRDDGRQRQGY